MLDIWLIRHGMTEGNRFSRYIGVTDESLCAEGQEQLKKFSYPDVQKVYVSPMKRCIETAEILFPNKDLCIVEELKECNFGDFENKNYLELSGNPDYQAWIDSDGSMPFPGGESKELFQKRSIEGFQKVVEACLKDNVTKAALVVHGGTIMSIMEIYADVRKSYYDWHVKNGEGYQVQIDKALWKKADKILHLCR